MNTSDGYSIMFNLRYLVLYSENIYPHPSTGRVGGKISRADTSNKPVFRNIIT